jgi:lipoprotein signal peptidase
VKKKANLKRLILLGLEIVGGWLVHNFLASRGEVIKNYGVSFGINLGVFSFLSIIFVLILLVFWWREKSLFLEIIIVGGTINLIDRLFFGGVSDYWYFFGVYNNLADWLIGIGIGLFLIKSLWKQQHK